MRSIGKGRYFLSRREGAGVLRRQFTNLFVSFESRAFIKSLGLLYFLQSGRNVLFRQKRTNMIKNVAAKNYYKLVA
jgi:hypothetical protein